MRCQTRYSKATSQNLVHFHSAPPLSPLSCNDGVGTWCPVILTPSCVKFPSFPPSLPSSHQPQMTLVFSLMSMPCFFINLRTVLLTSMSIPIPPTWPRNSTAVTFDPSRLQTEPCINMHVCMYSVCMYVCTCMNAWTNTYVRTYACKTTQCTNKRLRV